MGEQIHDKYVKGLLEEVARNLFVSKGPDVKVNYQGAISASIDGVIKDCCAIEVESRVAKQVRGALVDLLEHRLPKKLLILVPAHMNNPEATAQHCEYILEKYKQQGSMTKVILLKGTGNNPKEEDKSLIEDTLKEMDCFQNG